MRLDRCVPIVVAIMDAVTHQQRFSSCSVILKSLLSVLYSSYHAASNTKYQITVFLITFFSIPALTVEVKTVTKAHFYIIIIPCEYLIEHWTIARSRVAICFIAFIKERQFFSKGAIQQIGVPV